MTILEVEFYNYALETLIPITLSIETELSYNINQGENDIIYGRTSGGRIHGNAVLQNNNLKIVPTQTTTMVLSKVDSLLLKKLTTAEKEYTKFKFIQ